MRRMLDIYSGLGGASEAFIKAGWEVHRLENNLLLTDLESEYYVPGTTHQDVLEWPFHELPSGYYDFIWASPPCREFSTAYAAPRSVAARNNEEYEPNMQLVTKAKEIIDWFQPTYWVIENVSGASKYISKLLQVPPRQIVGPFFLWGNFPFITMDYDWTHSKADGDTWSTDPIRTNRRGKIPFELSNKFLLAITNQSQITEWME